MKLDKLRKKTVAELLEDLTKGKIKLNDYKFELKLGKEKDAAKVSGLRKNVAQILTVLREKS